MAGDDLLLDPTSNFQLSLVVGGNYPCKWTLYEYTPGPTQLAQGVGTQPFDAGKVANGKERKFVWSATVVTNDDTPTEIKVWGQARQRSTVQEVSGTVEVSKKEPNFFVHLWVKGI